MMITTKFKKRMTGGAITTVVGISLLACGGKLPGGLPNVPGTAACPDVTKVEEVEKFDFVANYGIKAEGAAKLKSAAVAAINIQGISDKMEADLKTACTSLSTDLGGASTYASAEDACNGAIKVMGDAKAKLGASVTIGLDIVPPECHADMDVYASCAGHCDASVTGPSAKVQCEPGKLSGTCGGSCTGSCDVKAAVKCDGSCSGTCDAQIKGTCNGKCDGKCDGKSSKGAACTGTCEGKCDADMDGTCKGKCGGTCKSNASASCDGTCHGSCSVEMQAPKCDGQITPPKMSAECQTKCDSDVQAKLDCQPAKVAIAIHGAADATAAATFKAALEKNLPGVLKVAIGMADTGPKLAAEATTMLDGVQGSIKDIAASAGGAKGAMTAANITSCFGGPFKGAIDAAAKVKANVNVSVNVKASASASASGSAAGGGKAG